jgi:hypothetical protein
MARNRDCTQSQGRQFGMHKMQKRVSLCSSYPFGVSHSSHLFVSFFWGAAICVNESHPFQSFSENVIQHIFVEKMLKMECSQLTQAGFHLFERFFIVVNEKNGKIRITDDNIPSVTSNDLIGLSKFWEIALNNKNNTVATAAANSLNTMHQNV